MLDKSPKAFQRSEVPLVLGTFAFNAFLQMDSLLYNLRDGRVCVRVLDLSTAAWGVGANGPALVQLFGSS